MRITVSEIADRVVKQGPSRETFIERVHYWTRERLISPVGKRNPGTGKHRLYDSSVVLDTVILNAMADVGIPIAAQRTIIGIVRQERHLGWRVKEAKNFYLVVEGGSAPHAYFWPPLGFMPPPDNPNPSFTVNEHADSSIVFNLTRLFSVLQNETGETNG